MSNAERKASETNDGGIVADRHLYLARARKGVVESEGGQRVVEANDPDAAYLLVAPGDTISAEQVEALGLSVVGGKVKQSAKAAKDASTTVAGVTISHDQETGPALKRAAEERRAKDRASGRTQTEVAVTAPPPGAEDMARDESDEETAKAKVSSASKKKD